MWDGYGKLKPGIPYMALGIIFNECNKKGFSALEMQRLIGHSRYEPIWLLMYKIRVSMGNRDNKYKLDGFTEMDEGFFEGHRKKEAFLRGIVKKKMNRQKENR